MRGTSTRAATSIPRPSRSSTTMRPNVAGFVFLISSARFCTARIIKQLGMAKPRSVLFVAPECVPFAHVGGLGDVAAALPAALAREGVDARIVLPRYGSIPTGAMKRHDRPLGVPLAGSEAWCGVFEARLPGADVPVYLLDHEGLFGRDY